MWVRFYSDIQISKISCVLLLVASRFVACVFLIFIFLFTPLMAVRGFICRMKGAWIGAPWATSLNTPAAFCAPVRSKLLPTFFAVGKMMFLRKSPKNPQSPTTLHGFSLKSWHGITGEHVSFRRSGSAGLVAEGRRSLSAETGGIVPTTTRCLIGPSGQGILPACFLFLLD